MKTFICAFLSVFIIAASLSAQSALDRPNDDKQKAADAIGRDRVDSKFSLFDLSRLDMNHSYSIAWFSSGGKGTTLAMYMNSMTYQISRPLTLHLDLAWVHQPGNLLFSDRGTPTDYGSIYPSFSLEYRPSDKFHLEIGYHSYPASYNYNYYRPWYDRYDRDWPGSFFRDSRDH